jgi:hypothetical protein
LASASAHPGERPVESAPNEAETLNPAQRSSGLTAAALRRGAGFP